MDMPTNCYSCGAYWPYYYCWGSYTNHSLGCEILKIITDIKESIQSKNKRKRNTLRMKGSKTKN